MASHLTFRFEPLADLFLLITDRDRFPTSTSWEPVRRAVTSYLDALVEAAASGGGGHRAGGALQGLIAEARTIDELDASIPTLPDERVLGLPWGHLVSLAVDALRLAEPLYTGEIADARRTRVTEALEGRVRTQLGPHLDECLAFIHDRLELPDDDVEIPVVLVATAPFPGAFTSLSDETGAICFVQVDTLDGTALIETILHEATHAFEYTSSGRRGSVLARLARSVDAVCAGDPAGHEVAHSLIFVNAAETTRRIIDREHVHYGVSHAYYERVPSSKPVVEHWGAHLDGAIDADTAIERIVNALRR